MDIKIPSLDSFIRSAENLHILSLTISIPWDHETIISLADRFVDEENFFLLESASSGSSHIARYSHMGFDPLWTWKSEGCQGEVSFNSGPESFPLNSSTNPLLQFYSDFSDLKVGHCTPDDYRGPEPSAQSGVVGYLSYDVASRIEKKAGKAPRQALGLPEIYYFIPRNYFIFDLLSHSLTISRYTDVRGLDKDGLTKLWNREVNRLKELCSRLKESHKIKGLNVIRSAPDHSLFESTISRPDFEKKALACLEEVKKGEIFQIQIGRRMTRKTDARPFDIFRHLRMLNPSPYMFFYKFGDDHILGASPEMMVNVEGRQVTHRPIAGTRKRTWNATTDTRMRKELVSSEKERAEHVMLVDLSRNDIGKVASPGTVTVRELMVVEEYSHVFHMVSEVTGELKSDLNAADALSAGYPNGTVSGAPKIRAMEIINKTEPVAREFYAGSLGMFAFNGDLKSTILIRSIHIKNGIASTQASAGIVYDSEPALEWNETCHKMAACLTAIQNTQA